MSDCTVSIAGYVMMTDDYCLSVVQITLAQFADDAQRSRLRAFLTRYAATEVLLATQAHSKETLQV